MRALEPQRNRQPSSACCCSCRAAPPAAVNVAAAGCAAGTHPGPLSAAPRCRGSPARRPARGTPQAAAAPPRSLRSWSPGRRLRCPVARESPCRAGEAACGARQPRRARRPAPISDGRQPQAGDEPAPAHTPDVGTQDGSCSSARARPGQSGRPVQHTARAGSAAAVSGAGLLQMLACPPCSGAPSCPGSSACAWAIQRPLQTTHVEKLRVLACCRLSGKPVVYPRTAGQHGGMCEWLGDGWGLAWLLRAGTQAAACRHSAGASS